MRERALMTARVHHRRTSPSSSKSITLALLKRGGRGLRIPLRTRTPSSEFFLVALQANKSENGNEKRTRNNGQDDDPRWPRESAQSLIPSRTMRHVEQSLESISVLSPRSRPSSAIQRLDETCRLRRRPPSITTPFFFFPRRKPFTYALETARCQGSRSHMQRVNIARSRCAAPI